MTTQPENVATPAYVTGSEDATTPAETTDPHARLSLELLADDVGE